MNPFYENRSTEYYAFDWEKPFAWPQHLHHHIEIIYVVHGEAEVTIDLQPDTLRQGDLLLAFPYCVHSCAIPDNCLPGTHVRGMLLALSLTGNFAETLLKSQPRHPIIRAEECSAEITFALEHLLDEQDHFRPQIAKSYSQLLLALLWPLLDVVTVNERSADDAYRAVRYVIEHYREPLQARMVSEALGISPSRLARLFSSRLHIGFNEYLNQLRVQAAQDLLRSTSDPIIDIMMKTGFENQSTFNRVFHDMLGVSPREYRQKQQEPVEPSSPENTK